LGRLTGITDPQGGIKAYTYDAVENLLSFTDQEGVTSKYKYDELNRKEVIIQGRSI
jgi:YD repeat-containing protein